MKNPAHALVDLVVVAANDLELDLNRAECAAIAARLVELLELAHWQIVQPEPTTRLVPNIW